VNVIVGILQLAIHALDIHIIDRRPLAVVEAIICSPVIQWAALRSSPSD
jgi:hypothetical protein